MKKSLWKNNFKVIFKTRRRFISILVMAFLGVGFFSGLVATGPDMQDSLDKYVNSSNMYDIDIVSTLGLTDDDINAIKNIEGVESAYGIQTKDTIVTLQEEQDTCKVIEYNENSTKPVLVEGRLPENSNECLLDYLYVRFSNPSDFIGKTINIQNEETDTDGNPVFTQKELTIVGICNSPLYISSERGNTTIGSGKIDFYIYTKDDVINLDYYTNIYVNVSGAKELTTNSDKYLNTVNPVISKIEAIKQEREEARYNQLVNDATEELNKAKDEFNTEKAKADSEILDAENKINEAKTQIQDSENQLDEAEKELNTQEANSKKQFANAQAQIDDAQEQLTSKKQELENAKTEFNNKKSEAESAIQEIQAGITEANTYLQTLYENKKQLENEGLDTTQIDLLITQTENTLNNLNNQKAQIEQEVSNAQAQITYAETEIANGEKELENQINILASSKKQANTEIANGRKTISSSRQELEQAKQELATNEAEFETQKQEANQKIQDAQNKLNDAQDQINEIEKAKWYIQDRKDNTGYSNIIDAITTLTNVAKIFPVIFYIVAILISLTSMTRMIEEERVEIGTLKALGYNNFQIIIKYILYALLACIIGGFLGMTVGFYLIPNIVWEIYSAIYIIPSFYATYRLNIGLAGLIIAFICIGGSTIFVAVNELKNMPSTLMRPKSPKIGKKIFLERIHIIWKKFNFSQKITIRNIFRYKKRAIMTVVGITGCCGLILTGFGIKDSVMDIPETQFGELFKYDMSIALSSNEQLEELKNMLSSNENVEEYAEVCSTTGTLVGSENNYDATIFVPDSIEQFEKMFELRTDSEGEKISLSDNGIVITSKVAEFLNVKPGDQVTLIDSDDLEYNFKVDAITENYVSHYVYMSKTFYETNIKSYSTNTIFITTPQIDEEAQTKLSEDILNITGVASVTNINDLVESVRDMLVSLDYVVVILIVASALLAFVVLYNLANINIGERQREIATLKVLGFYDKEVDNYINKENIVFTSIGVILGLIFGYFLTNVVIASVEIDSLKFIKNVLPLSYVYAASLTIIFSIIVNFIIHFVLKKIDMIESLKSVE